MNEEETKIKIAAEKAEHLLEKAAERALYIVKEATSSIAATSESLIGIAKDIEYLKRDVGDIKIKLEHNFVTKDEFDAKFGPIQKLVFGLISVLGIATLGAIFKLVFIH